MSTDAWMMLLALIGFLVLWLFVLPRMGVA